MYPILFRLGSFELRSYGVVVALSVIAGLWLSTREARRKGIDPGLIQDFGLFALVAALVGARLYFVAFSDPGYFLRNPWEILAVWRGGIGVIGAMLGVALAALWFSRRNRISFWGLADTLAPGMALAQTIGQLACLLNGDSYGKPTNLPWAITYTDPRSFAPLNVPLHPIEIYEMGAYFVVFLVVWKTRKQFKAEGFSFLTYLAAYGVARFSMEFFRGNPAIFAAGIPAAQVFSVALALVALAGFFVLGKRQPTRSLVMPRRKGTNGS